MLFISTNQLIAPQIQGVGIELRIDLFRSIQMDEIKHFLQTSSCPVMITVRNKLHERDALIEALLALRPPFFDLEYDMDQAFILKMMARYPDTKFILSSHHFDKIPDDLEEIYQRMQSYAPFCCKIAVMVHSTNEALRMLLFAKTYPKTTMICMGEKGAFARVLGPVFGNLIDYAKMDGGEETGLGQLSATELIDAYSYFSLNRQTAIYGLIGDPVRQSLGHIYHNHVFRNEKLNAVYIKMNVKSEELVDFFSLAKAIGIRGLSVTSPLKEKVLPFIDRMDFSAEQIQAVNTLLFKEGKMIGANTDGVGALDAIEKKCGVRGKKIVLLGAGGACRAIAFEGKARGADVMILNRTFARAEKMGKEMGCKAGSLDETPPCDILINGTSDLMPIDPEKMRGAAWVMDLAYFSKETPFLKEASSRGCQIIYGEEMFFNQAARQSAFWRS